MSNENAYSDLITSILQNKKKAFGKLAIDTANNVEGLTVDHGGTVTQLDGNPKRVIENLLSDFEKIAGKTSTIAAKMFVPAILKKYPDVSIPKVLL